MEALRSVAADLPKVRIEITPRLYWGRYPVKIEFNAEVLTSRTLPISQAYRWRTIHNEILEALGLKDRVKVRSRDVFTTIYCLDEADAITLCVRLGATITSIACPRSAADLDLLAGDGTRLKPVLRTTLFWGKYEYGLSLKPSAGRDEMYDEIREWIERFKEMNDPDCVYLDPARVYFKREEDVAYFKLVFHEQIADFEKAILIKDIADARGSLEAVC